MTMTNHTSNYSHDCGVYTHRAEFDDGTEYLTVSLHADELNLKQKTKSYLSLQGRRFKVKSLEAFDQKGNRVTLDIFFDN